MLPRIFKNEYVLLYIFSSLLVFAIEMEIIFFFCLANHGIQYKGCAYTYANGCNLPLNPNISYAVIKQDCKQCSGKDGCNPAGRINIEVMTVFLTVIIVSLLR